MKLIGYRCSQQLSSNNHSILFPWDSRVFLAIGPQRSANKPINFRHSISSPTLSSSLDNIFMIDVITWMKSYLLCTIYLTGNNYSLTHFFRYYSCSLIFSIITTRNDRAYPFGCRSRKLLRLASSYRCDVSQLRNICKFWHLIVNSERAKQIPPQVYVPYTNVLPKSWLGLICNE